MHSYDVAAVGPWCVAVVRVSCAVGTSWTMLLAGFLSWTGAVAYPLKATTQVGTTHNLMPLTYNYTQGKQRLAGGGLHLHVAGCDAAHLPLRVVRSWISISGSASALGIARRNITY